MPSRHLDTDTRDAAAGPGRPRVEITAKGLDESAVELGQLIEVAIDAVQGSIEGTAGTFPTRDIREVAEVHAREALHLAPGEGLTAEAFLPVDAVDDHVTTLEVDRLADEQIRIRVARQPADMSVYADEGAGHNLADEIDAMLDGILDDYNCATDDKEPEVVRRRGRPGTLRGRR